MVVLLSVSTVLTPDSRKVVLPKTIWFSCSLTLTRCTDSGVFRQHGTVPPQEFWPICRAEPCCHSTPSLTAACTTCFYVLFVLCLIQNILSKNHICIVWSLSSPWYCIEKKKMWGKKNLVCWPSPVKNFSNIIIIRKDFKNVAFSCTKEKFMERASTVGNVLLCWTW